MDYEFSSKEELFHRVGPALRAKVRELKRLGYTYIQEIDVWNYLITNKWCKSKDLMLSDIVNDIMHAEIREVDQFLREKNNSRLQYFDNSLEIL